MHLQTLREVAAWALARGRTCDLDVCAVCLEALDPHRMPEGFRLQRPDVQRVLKAGAHSVLSMSGARLPDEWLIHLWTVLSSLHEDHGMHPEGDPLQALLEPLGCYGGLGRDGFPMPPGEDVDFPCQCSHPYDATCPPGLAAFTVGHHPETYADLVVRARLRLRTTEPSRSDLQPLWELRRRAENWWVVPFDELDPIGRIDPSGPTPELWLYHHPPSARRGFDVLALDADGQPWVAKPDRRYRSGFRFVRVRDVVGLARAGAIEARWAS